MAEPLRVLLIEDVESDAALVLRELRRDGRSVHSVVVEDSPGLRTALSGSDWDVVLSDYALPDFDAPAAHAVVREMRPDLPFVVVSGSIGEERAVELMRLGVAGYVLKDNLSRLTTVVDRAVQENREHAALSKLQGDLVTAGREWDDTFAAISDCVFLLAHDGTVHRFNRAAAKSFGRPGVEILGMAVRDLLDCGGPPVHDFDEPLCEGRCLSFELGPCPPDGMWFDARLDPVLGDTEALRGFVLVLSDVSRRKRSEQELRLLVSRLERMTKGAIAIAARMVESRDPYTAGHQEGVARVAFEIAQRLGMPAEQVEIIRTAALLHDIGKIAVPAETLVKPGKLSRVETLTMQRHPDVAASILEDAELGGPIAEIVRQHHERLDGSGYPDGVSGDEIRPEARVIAVADVAEAMLSHRPDRPAFSLEEARAELTSGRGILYDASAVDACLDILVQWPLAPLETAPTI